MLLRMMCSMMRIASYMHNGGPTNQAAWPSSSKKWTNKKRQRRENGSGIAIGPTYNKPKEVDVASRLLNRRPLRRSQENSEHCLREIITNGDHLKLKANFETAISEIMNMPSSSNVGQPNPSFTPEGTVDSALHCNFSCEPGDAHSKHVAKGPMHLNNQVG